MLSAAYVMHPSRNSPALYNFYTLSTNMTCQHGRHQHFCRHRHSLFRLERHCCKCVLPPLVCDVVSKVLNQQVQTLQHAKQSSMGRH